MLKLQLQSTENNSRTWYLHWK